MIAIITKDPLLGRMLQLEAERGGFSVVSPQEAVLLLTDTPPNGAIQAVVIGFGLQEDFPHASHVLPLPYDTRALQALLGHYHDKAALHPFPGGVLLCGKRITLSPTEERLLRILLKHRGEVVPPAVLQTADRKSTRLNSSHH